MEPRAPTEPERAILAALLDFEFEGVDALRVQLDAARVHPSCECGCGSLGFDFEHVEDLPRSTAGSPVPVYGEIVDEAGELVGGVLLLIGDGLLGDLDIHTFVGGAQPVPSMSDVRWSTLDR